MTLLRQLALAVLGVVCAALSPLRAQEATSPPPGWVLVAASADGMLTVRAHPDRMTVERGGVVRLWLRWEYPHGQRLRWLDGNPLSYAALARAEIDCVRQRYRETSRVYYDNRGRVLDTHEQALSWSDIVPDSVTEDFTQEICGYLELS